MADDLTLRTAVKNFSDEAGRFKIADLAQILHQPPKKIVKLLKDMMDAGELKGIYNTKKDEFVTTSRLKTEILRVFKNPALIK